jgi:putative flippase GtrA
MPCRRNDGRDLWRAVDAGSRRNARVLIEALADGMVPGCLSRYREQILYLAVGAWNTLFGYLVWAALQTILGGLVNYLVVVVLSYPIAVVNAYVCYRYVVFRSHGSIWHEIPRFSSVYLATLLANLLLLPILLRTLSLNIYVTQAFFTAVVVVVSYLGHRFFSFGGGSINDRRPQGYRARWQTKVPGGKSGED